VKRNNLTTQPFR